MSITSALSGTLSSYSSLATDTYVTGFADSIYPHYDPSRDPDFPNTIYNAGGVADSALMTTQVLGEEESVTPLGFGDNLLPDLLDFLGIPSLYEVSQEASDDLQMMTTQAFGEEDDFAMNASSDPIVDFINFLGQPLLPDLLTIDRTTSSIMGEEDVFGNILESY